MALPDAQPSTEVAPPRQTLPIGRILLSRGSLDGEALEGALQLQPLWGSRIGEILLALGRIDESAFAYALAEQMELPVFDGRMVPNVEDLAAREDAAFYAQVLLLPWTALDGRITYAAVDPIQVQSLLVERLGAERLALALVTKHDLLSAIERRFSPTFADSASEELFLSRPHYSARGRLTREQKPVIAGGVAALALCLVVAPLATLTGLGEVGALGFFGVMALRFAVAASAILGGKPRNAVHCPADNEFPVYSVLVPLFREARVVPDLVRALREFHYPELCSKRT